jgi:hypothetical protein
MGEILGILIILAAGAGIGLPLANALWAESQHRADRRRKPATTAAPEYDHKEERRLRKKAEHEEWWRAYMSLLPKAPEPPSLRRWSYMDECTCDVVEDTMLSSRSREYVVTRIDPECRYHGRASHHAEQMVAYEEAKRIYRRDTMYSLQQHPFQYARKAAPLPTPAELTTGILISAGELLISSEGIRRRG